jgi:glycosyltransferase involved in cell wall biosynthesis
MPSYFESLSMVALEAWALGKPVIANANCDVLKGQCVRSNAGLFYAGRDEFIETLQAVERNRWLANVLGRNGRQFFREHYDWPVIERKYLEMLDRLSKEPVPAVEPAPGWFERRKPQFPPGADVAAQAPRGA